MAVYVYDEGLSGGLKKGQGPSHESPSDKNRWQLD